MNEEAKFEVWGLSLSLKPPIITNLDHKPICKRESQFSIDEKNPQMNKLNNTLAMIPRINKRLVLKQPVEIIDLEEEDEKTGKVGSPKSTLSSVTGKRFGGDREMISDDEEGGNRGGGESSGGERKKLRLCKEQVLVLEQAFSEHTTLNTKQKVALATQVNLRPRQVEVWFQNRRARTKFKQTELDCEQLKKYCETLTEENKRLQKEVHELRALKFSPENSMMDANHPPTTLTMCPSCKNVSFSSSSATTGTPAVETGRSLMGVFHQHTPLSIQKLSFTINNNQVIESSKPRS